MRTETIFDRVPGSGDLKKAKRAANLMAGDHQKTSKRLNSPVRFPWRWALRMYRRQAMLKP